MGAYPATAERNAAELAGRIAGDLGREIALSGRSLMRRPVGIGVRS